VLTDCLASCQSVGAPGCRARSAAGRLEDLIGQRRDVAHRPARHPLLHPNDLLARIDDPDVVQPQILDRGGDALPSTRKRARRAGRWISTRSTPNNSGRT
jgi:hypothetical protein